jgi:hypothetical protein
MMHDLRRPNYGASSECIPIVGVFSKMAIAVQIGRDLQERKDGVL